MNDLLKISIGVVAVVVISTAGCISTETISAAQIKANALNSTEGVTSYSFFMTGTMGTTITNSTGSYASDISLTVNGAVDLSNEKLMMETDAEADSTIPEQQLEIKSTIYIIDDILYMQTDALGDTQWLKKNITNFEATWQSYSEFLRSDMDMQRQLLETSDVEKLNDEVVNGVNCYVLKIKPDIEKLYEILMSQQGINNSGVTPIGNLSDIIKGWSIKQWFAKDTNLLMKAYNQMTFEYSFDMGYTSVSFSYNIDMEILFSGYNSAVNIELPEEAEDATWSWLE